MGRWNTEYPEERLRDDFAGAMPFDAEERVARRLLRLEDPRPRTMGPAPVWWPAPGAVAPHDEAAAPPHDESPAQRQERIARDRAVYGPLVQARTAAQRELEEHGPAPEIFDRALRNLESAATHDPALQPRLQYTQAAARQWHAEHPRYADARARRDRADAEIRARAAAQAGRRTSPPGPREYFPLPTSDFPLPTGGAARPETQEALGDKGEPGPSGASAAAPVASPTPAASPSPQAAPHEYQPDDEVKLPDGRRGRVMRAEGDSLLVEVGDNGFGVIQRERVQPWRDEPPAPTASSSARTEVPPVPTPTPTPAAGAPPSSGNPPPVTSATPGTSPAAPGPGASIPRPDHLPLPPSNAAPAAPAAPAAVPDSTLSASFQAAAARGTFNTLSGIARFLADSEMTSGEFLAHMDQAIGDTAQGLENLRAQQQRRGYTTADDAWLRRNLENELARLQGLREGSRRTLYNPAQDADKLARRKGAHEQADNYAAAAEHSDEYYGANRHSTNAAAQFGRAGGAFLPTLPAMILGPGAAVAQMSAQTYGDTFQQKAQELRAAGVRDENEIHRYAREMAGQEVLQGTPQMGLYVVGGRIVARGTARLLPATAGPVSQAAAGAGGAFVSNATAGMFLRAIQGQDWQPTIESLTSDALFGIYHGTTVWREANAQAKRRAAYELERRKQVAAAATPAEKKAVESTVLGTMADADRQAAALALTKRRKGEPLNEAEDALLTRVKDGIRDELASKQRQGDARASHEWHPNELPYWTNYYESAGRNGENISDILDKIRMKGIPLEEDIKNSYIPRRKTITYSKDAKRWEPLEEFLHARVHEEFKAKEIAALSKELGRSRRTLSGKWIKMKAPGRAAEEIVVKQTLLNTLWGLSSSERELLNSQIDYIRKNGASRY